uniref:Uncharacterized protein n=1 Tax=Ditylenchus dipsaci TaxID=166011 RepID=A0A915DBN1_9BILA
MENLKGEVQNTVYLGSSTELLVVWTGRDWIRSGGESKKILEQIFELIRWLQKYKEVQVALVVPPFVPAKQETWKEVKYGLSSLPNQGKLTVVIPKCASSRAFSEFIDDAGNPTEVAFQDVDQTLAQNSLKLEKKLAINQNHPGEEQPSTSQATSRRSNKGLTIGYYTMGLITWLALMTMLHSAIASGPMICRHQGLSSSVLTIPKTDSLCEEAQRLKGNPQPLTITIWQPNVKKRSRKATSCHIIESTVAYYTNLLNDNFLDYTNASLAISPEECKIMAESNQCSHGELKATGL